MSYGYPENAPLEIPDDYTPDVHEARIPQAVPLTNELIEHVKASARDIRALVRHATTLKAARVYTGLGSGSVDAAGNIFINCFEVPAGFRAFVSRVVIEVMGNNAGNPFNTANTWVGLYEVEAGQTTRFEVNIAANQVIGSLLDFSPQPDNTRVIPATFENGADAAPVVDGGNVLAIQGFLGVPMAARRVTAKYKLLVQEK